MRASAAIVAAAGLVVATQSCDPSAIKKIQNLSSHATVVENPDRDGAVTPGVFSSLMGVSELRLNPKPLVSAIKATTQPAPEIAAEPAFTLPAFNVQHMTLSKGYIEKLKLDEGYVPRSYLDNGPGSTWTIGYGHTGYMPDGRPIGPGMTVTDAEAEALLVLDLEAHSNAVKELLKNTPVTQGQYESLVDFSFNKGPEALASSTLLKKLKEGDYIGSADQYLRWTKVTRRDASGNPVLDERGRRIMDELPGLVKRAQDKRAEMLNGFSVEMIDSLDRGLDSIRVAGRSIARAETRLRGVQITGSKLSTDAATLEGASKSLDKHVEQIYKKVDMNKRLVRSLQAEVNKLEERYKTAMKEMGPHINVQSEEWLPVADLANQVHVLNRVAFVRQMEIDRDLEAANRYEKQSIALRAAGDALLDGVAALKAQPAGNEDIVALEKISDRLFEASNKIQDVMDDLNDLGEDASTKSLLSDRHSQRLVASLEKTADKLQDKIASYDDVSYRQMARQSH